ncbi:hypothetical protein GCM10029964_116620 [Kibdelosporangium lantanae]
MAWDGRWDPRLGLRLAGEASDGRSGQRLGFGGSVGPWSLVRVAGGGGLVGRWAGGLVARVGLRAGGWVGWPVERGRAGLAGWGWLAGGPEVGAGLAKLAEVGARWLLG